MSKLGLILIAFIINVIFSPIMAGVIVNPRYAPGVETLSHSHHYITTHTATTYWQISPYYIPQKSDSSCSLATAAMIVNAARSHQQLPANEPLATEDGLLKRVKNDAWSDAVKQGGDGVTLKQLKTYMASALNAYGVHDFTIKIRHIKQASNDNTLVLHDTLLANEKSGNTFMVVNFNQKFFTGAMSVGHFSPVAGYDSDTKRVLIMDPDREFYEPYWVPEQLLLKSMATVDSDAGTSRGYLLVTVNNPARS